MEAMAKEKGLNPTLLMYMYMRASPEKKKEMRDEAKTMMAGASDQIDAAAAAVEEQFLEE